MSTDDTRFPEGPLDDFDDDDDSSQKRGIMRGFSLIELLLVVAIISILAGIAFLSMLHYGIIIRVNASARDLGGHMRVARAEAIATGQRYLFRFAPNDTYIYGPSNSSGNGFAGTAKTYKLQDGIVFGFMTGTVAVPGHRYPIPCATHIEYSPASCVTQDLLMNRDGTFGASGVAYVSPTSDVSGTGARDDRQRAVDWTATTGRVRVWRYFAGTHHWQ